EESDALRVDGGLWLVGIHGTCHAAREVGLQVRVLAAQHSMDADELALKLQRFDVMGDSEEIRFRRQLIGRMSPVAAGEQAELLAFHQYLHAVLNRFEVCAA